MGYMALSAAAPVVEVSAICHRAEAIFHGYLQQMPPSEGHLVWELGALGPLWFYLTEKMGLSALRDMAIVAGSAGLSMLAIQVEPGRPDMTRQLTHVLARLHFGQRFVILVDEDIDIRDANALHWALSSRVDPARDIQLLEDVPSYQLDPAVLAGMTPNERESGAPPFSSSMMIIDATLKCDTPEISLPGKSWMARARERWSEFELPELIESERLRRLLEYHSDEDLHYRLPDHR